MGKIIKIGKLLLNNQGLILLILLTLLTGSSCKKKHPLAAIEIPIDTGWTFHISGNPSKYPATVPGDIVSDLLNNKLISDPYFNFSMDSVRWVEHENWEYQTTFDVPENIFKNDELALFFGGLDTYADVYLNDTLILEADNMFRSWEIPCKKWIKKQNNVLRVNFFIKDITESPAPLQSQTHQALNTFHRKASFHFGTDANPPLINAGIWRPVTLRAWNQANITGLYLQPKSISKELAIYELFIDFNSVASGNYQLQLYLNDAELETFPVTLPVGKKQLSFEFQITKPSLWWCNGMGAQNLYNLNLQLWNNNILLCSKKEQFGIRKLELVRETGKQGGSFYFTLNDVPLYIKGASYYALDLMAGRFSTDRYGKLVNDAVFSNMNMLRIRGSGIYENSEFYDLCDQKGILIWHDFMLPELPFMDDSLKIESIKKEVIENVCKLRNHPCMALWCGNLLPEKTLPTKLSRKHGLFSNKLNYQDVIPNIVKTYSPHIHYLQTSPSDSARFLGDVFDWRVWKEMAPLESLQKVAGRFVSEFGMQSFPSVRTLNTFSGDTANNYQSAQMQYRQRYSMPWVGNQNNGNDMILDYIQMYYNEPANWKATVYLSQIMQGEALKTAIEQQRVNRGFCMGSVYRQINDCWPAISLSTIDYTGCWKPAQYSVKKAFATILLVPFVKNGNVFIYAINDSTTDLNCTLKIDVKDFTGLPINTSNFEVTLPSNTSKLLYRVSQRKICPEALKTKVFLSAVLTLGQKELAENVCYFSLPKFLDLPVPDINYTISELNQQYVINIRSNKLAKNLVLETNVQIAQFSENNFDLLPGQEKTIYVTYPGSKEDLKNDLNLINLGDSY